MIHLDHTEQLVRDRHQQLHREAESNRLLHEAGRTTALRNRLGRLLVRAGRRLDRANDRTPTSTPTVIELAEPPGEPRSLHRAA